MRKTIFYLSLFVLVSSCFVASVTANAAPTITGIHGGYGVTATVMGAKGRDWQIYMKGPFMIHGMKTEGTISSEKETIRTHIFPPTFGIGKIWIKITINRIIFPDIVEERSALLVGPFVLFIHKA